MAGELQPLLDQIQKEGIEKAETEASAILARAKEQSAKITGDAEAAAAALIAKAEADAKVFEQRGVATLEQAARDVILSVGQGIKHIFDDLVLSSTGDALRPDVLETMMVKMAQASAERLGTESRIELLISKADQGQLVNFFMDKYREKLIHGVELHADNGVLKGFKVSFADDYVFLDFTQDAIAKALMEFLRPKLAEIVGRAAQKTVN